MFGLIKKIITPETQKEAQPTAEDVRGIIPLISQAPYELKIKQVSLGLEIRLIKNNEKRLWKRQAKARKGQSDTSMPVGAFRRKLTILGLESHREELSVEARATNLARAFLKGKAYSTVENKCREDNDPFHALDRASEIAAKWGEGDKRTIAQAFERWEQEAAAYYEANKIPPLTAVQQQGRYVARLNSRGEQLSLTPEDQKVRRAAYWNWQFAAHGAERPAWVREGAYRASEHN